MKLLIVGHARHGKDSVAAFLYQEFGLTSLASSEAASTLFVFDSLKEKYGYSTVDECFEDRVNHRSEWYDLIFEYNAGDRAKLAKEVVRRADVYVGMRSQEELDACLEQGVFDAILGVIDRRRPQESSESMNIDIWKHVDVMIENDGTLEELREKVKSAYSYLYEALKNKKEYDYTASK